MRTFPARFSTLCLPCDSLIEPGDECVRHDEVGTIHLHCLDKVDEHIAGQPAERREGVVRTIDVMPRGKTARDSCNRCFLVHTPAQGDDCE